MIAAFTDDGRNPDLAEVLTQEQAESVRNYLVEKHKIQSAGWFKSRKVAAVGFGARTPPSLDPRPPSRPADASRSSCSRRRRSQPLRVRPGRSFPVRNRHVPGYFRATDPATYH